MSSQFPTVSKTLITLFAGMVFRWQFWSNTFFNIHFLFYSLNVFIQSFLVHTLLDLNCFRSSSYVAQKWFFEWVGGRLWPFIHNSCLIATYIDLCIVIELLYMFFGGAFIQLKTVLKLKRQLFELVILRPFLVILLPATSISFTKLRFCWSFWDA